jgi:hypothetical protein
MKPARTKLTYANVMATVAVFLVLAGGTAFAASQMLPKNSVGARQLRKGAVTLAKLAPKARATLTGPRGATGARGPQGQTGPIGSQGAKGDRGEIGPVGPSTVFAGFRDEGPALATSGTTVGELTGMPPGAYVIQAKLLAQSEGTENDLVRCVLSAETDTDEAESYLGSGSVSGGYFQIYAMQIVHTFPPTATTPLVRVTCSHNIGTQAAAVGQIKITAIKVGSIATNHFIG